MKNEANSSSAAITTTTPAADNNNKKEDLYTRTIPSSITPSEPIVQPLPQTITTPKPQTNGAVKKQQVNKNFEQQHAALQKTLSLDRRQQQTNQTTFHQEIIPGNTRVHPITRERSKSFERKDRKHSNEYNRTPLNHQHGNKKETRNDGNHHQRYTTSVDKNPAYQIQVSSSTAANHPQSYVGASTTLPPKQGLSKKITPPPQQYHTPYYTGVSTTLPNQGYNKKVTPPQQQYHTPQYVGVSTTLSNQGRNKKVTPPSQPLQPQVINYDDLYAKVDKSFYRASNEASQKNLKTPLTSHNSPSSYGLSPTPISGAAGVNSSGDLYSKRNQYHQQEQQQNMVTSPQRRKVSPMQQNYNPQNVQQHIISAPLVPPQQQIHQQNNHYHHEDLYAKVDKTKKYIPSPSSSSQQQLNDIPVNNIKVVKAVPIMENLSPNPQNNNQVDSNPRKISPNLQNSGSLQQQPQDLSASWSGPSFYSTKNNNNNINNSTTNNNELTTVANMVAKNEDLSSSWPSPNNIKVPVTKNSNKKQVETHQQISVNTLFILCIP